jgi:hypothetical protein
MRQKGNPTQWGDTYPNDEIINRWIDKDGYVVVDSNGKIVAVFGFVENTTEPGYDSIDGAWLNDEPYSVVHALAVSHTNIRAAKFIGDWVFKRSNNLRVDTHKDNVIMQNLLLKTGFVLCGEVEILTTNGIGKRLAYQRYVNN